MSQLESLNIVARRLSASPQMLSRRARAGELPGVVEHSSPGAKRCRWAIRECDLRKYIDEMAKHTTGRLTSNPI